MHFSMYFSRHLWSTKIQYLSTVFLFLLGINSHAALLPPPNKSDKPFALKELDEVEAEIPNVLYSWTTQKKLDSMLKQFQKQNGFFPQVYASRTPLSTFMYGPILVRIKLRTHDLRVREVEKERYFELQDGSNAIISHLRTANNVPLQLLEYVFRSFTDDLIESISYSVPEIKKEMEQELALINDPDHYHLDLAFREKGRPLLFYPGAPQFDMHDWNKEVFNQRFDEIDAQIKAGKGKVIYASGFNEQTSPHFGAQDVHFVSEQFNKSAIDAFLAK